jgi:MFS superfamily sulfate permease-like transporter
MGDKQDYATIVLAIILFLVITSPNWQDVLGFSGSGPVVMIAVVVLALLAWVIKGTE